MLKFVFFLDIDGVLNIDWKRKWKKESVDNLNIIYTFFLNKNIEIEYVITSTWRISNDLEEMKTIFTNQNVKGNIIGFTPLIENDDRGKEILQYLNMNNVKNYLIIDDNIDSIIDYIDNDKIIEIDSDIGIDKKIVNKIVNLI